ncbi:HAD family hydrolase [Streptomyces bluensis]|uniref:HAD family hydrolase n=1 Tax=Streptomyces bluensis TaxID=33897 RepID=A0ABW6UKW0_9ACTN
MTSECPPTVSESIPELVLFDLDGVLFDSMPVMRSAWEVLEAERGIRVPFEAYAEHLGRPFADIMTLLGLDDDIQGLAEAYAAAAACFAHLARPFPGVEEVLRDIAATGCRLGVVTSKSSARAVPMLNRLRSAFSVLRTPDHGRGKPSPDTLLMALVDTRTDPAKALYVGDMAVDQEAAQRAGVRYVHAGWGYGSPTKPLPLILSEPAELIRLLRATPEKGPA